MIKATFILYRKNGPSVVLLSIPAAPAKGDLVYVDGSMYRVSDLCWHFNTNPKEEHEIVITLNQVN